MGQRQVVLGLGLTIIMVMVLTSYATAYTTDGGLEENDRVKFSYELYVDGSLYQKSKEFETTVSLTNLVEGFYKNVLGMKLGESRSFTVPPDEGYTSPSHELYGKTLDFRNVVLLEIVVDASPNDGSPSVINTSDDTQGSKLGEALVTYILPGLAVVGIIYVLFLLRHRIGRVVNRAEALLPAGMKKHLSVCEVCGAPQEGNCKKCGAKLCRNCFGTNCPYCGSNVFIAKKK